MESSIAQIQVCSHANCRVNLIRKGPQLLPSCRHGQPGGNCAQANKTVAHVITICTSSSSDVQGSGRQTLLCNVSKPAGVQHNYTQTTVFWAECYRSLHNRLPWLASPRHAWAVTTCHLPRHALSCMQPYNCTPSLATASPFMPQRYSRLHSVWHQ
jgi:hypothetical protein